MTDLVRAQLVEALAAKGIADARVLAAIASIPREAFVTGADLLARAYNDESLPIECEQRISQPFIVAYMTEKLRLEPGHDVLEIGTGSGYQTAILARLARHVYTVERHRELHDLAVARLEALGFSNVTAIAGDGAAGWPYPRTFDRILVAAAALKAPAALLGRLVPGGSMVMPLGKVGEQRLTLITRNGAAFDRQPLIAVRFVPLLSGI